LEQVPLPVKKKKKNITNVSSVADTTFIYSLSLLLDNLKQKKTYKTYNTGSTQ